MFYCPRCGVRFSAGALSGSTDCPRCMVRDGVPQSLRAEQLRPIERLGPWQPSTSAKPAPSERSAPGPAR